MAKTATGKRVQDWSCLTLTACVDSWGDGFILFPHTSAPGIVCPAWWSCFSNGSAQKCALLNDWSQEKLYISSFKVWAPLSPAERPLMTAGIGAHKASILPSKCLLHICTPPFIRAFLSQRSFALILWCVIVGNQTSRIGPGQLYLQRRTCASCYGGPNMQHNADGPHPRCWAADSESFTSLTSL